MASNYPEKLDKALIRPGRIDINLISKSGKFLLSLKDNGVGISEEITVENTDALGLQLVCTLIEQMEG